MTQYHLDFETYSPEDINKYGAFKYAEHPDTEILICAIARGDEDPVVWRCDQDAQGWENVTFGNLLRGMLEEPDAVIYAHNSQFETAIAAQLWEKTFGTVAPDLSEWRCTAAMARRAAIPSALGACAQFLGLGEQKDKEGK